MKRKRITEMFPFLLPLRKKQRKAVFYAKMRFDNNQYAQTIANELLPYCIYETKSKLLNDETGFDMRYQENKIFNLQLAAQTVNGLLIRPGETFSFWDRVRYADKDVPYKDGLCVVNGELTTVPGGGLCQLSSLLYWLFLRTPLTIKERHPHHIQDFPTPDESEPDGVDATVSEGWLDLKVTNNTDYIFQTDLYFDDAYIYGRILADRVLDHRYEIVNHDKSFFEKSGKIFERVTVYRKKEDVITGQVISEDLLYTDRCEVGYPLPEGTAITKLEE